MLLFIPFTRFSWNIYRSKSEVEAELAARVQPRRIFRSRSIFSKPDPSMPFAGKVENGRFNINRIINYRNSFLPIIVGELHDQLDVTRVEITIRLHYAVFVFFVVWLIVFGGAFGVGITEATGEFGPLPLFIGVLVLFYLIMMLFFNFEANKARQFLEQTWQISDPQL